MSSGSFNSLCRMKCLTRPISSAAWTGPPEPMSAPYPATFTHLVGGQSVTSDYIFLRDKSRLAAQFPQELRPVVGSAVLLLLAQGTLWIGSRLLDFASNDWRIADQSDRLFLWACGAIVISMWQIASRSTRLILLRRAVLALLIMATIGLAAGNVYLGMRSKAEAIASRPERVYALSTTSGRGRHRRAMITFQRADGSFVNGQPATTPVEYGRACALVQRLDGPDGYSWVKVRQWSRSPTSGQMAWPIRREECFSNIPLSTLPR